MMHRQNKNVSAARVELLQVSEVAGGLKPQHRLLSTATPLTCNKSTFAAKFDTLFGLSF